MQGDGGAARQYDELWGEQWGDLQRQGPVHRHNLRRLVEVVRALNPRDVLDVGCGGGDNLAALAKTTQCELSGVDVSAVALRMAADRVPSAQLSQLDIQRERLPRTFDLVISVQVIEHLLDDVSSLANMAAMTRRHVYISTIQGRMRASERAIGHVRNYSRRELESKLQAAGLRVVKVDAWGFPFYSPIYRSLIELLSVGQSTGRIGPVQSVLANTLYHLYRLNWPGKGDVITALAIRE